ncbi:MAG TPA: saccharopine dehydrogenase C-terminal domain-containing protein, partial [Candidatus Thermoplasmatota archaeon]|nr:saccharopine dehydrogenase C-terminal domain-containing protein [Candidatus Thermoplasmatota archaeon]
ADVREPPSVPASCAFLRVDGLDAADVRRAAAGAEAAVLALPGGVAHRALANLVAARVPVADVSFSPESPLVLDKAAQLAGIPVVVDVGVAPGLSHVLAAALRRELGDLDRIEILVGGMPLAPPPVFHHAVYFHARDLLDEYIRPARMRVAGADVAPDPLDAAPSVFIDEEVGVLEAFPSDGLRTLLTSWPEVRDMVELTLRLPGHLETMRALKALGLLRGDEATDALARALARGFAADPHPDRLLMEVRGARGDRTGAYRMHALRRGGESAMTRSTGLTTAAVAWLLARRGWTRPGVHAPEAIGEDAVATEALLADLAARGLPVTRGSRMAP